MRLSYSRPVPCLCSIYVVTHVVPADHGIIVQSAGTMSAYHICGHTCGTSRLYYNPMVGQYHVCVAYMWLHMWYQPITPLHHCRPVPHVQPHICYTDMVLADHGIIVQSAGTTCVTTYMIRRHSTGRLYYNPMVGRYHMCDHIYATQTWYRPTVL